MKYLDLQLDQPDWMLHPMQQFIRETDVVQYEELISWNIQPDAGVEYELFYAEVTDIQRYRAAIDAVDSLQEYHLSPIDDTALYVWACQTTRPADQALRAAFADRRLVIVPPVRYDTTAAMRFTIVGPGTDIQTLLKDLPDGIDVTINEIGTYDRRGGTLAGTLTDRQLDAVATAYHLGYFDVPRGNDLTTVADALNAAKSTTSILLRRATRNIFEHTLDHYGGHIDHNTATTTPTTHAP